MPENPKAANFGDIYLNLGTNYDINCQLISFDVTKHNEKGNRYQDCALWDGYDQKKVKIWEGRNGMPLEEKNRSEWLTFSLSARAGTGKWKNNKYLGGFWDSSAAVIDKAQLPTQGTNASLGNYKPPQGVQQPAGATKAPQPVPQGKKEPDWDAIAEGKVRHGILCAMLQGGISVDYPEVLRHTIFVMTGIDPDTVPDPDKEITECPHCGKPHNECSCTVPF